MTALPDTVEISQLSIPGTHDTMALHGGDSGHTHSLSLRAQLDAGIRYIDIRCFHVDNKCKLYHGATNQFATLGDVLGTLQSFLTTNPGEFVIMRLREEGQVTNERGFEGNGRQADSDWKDFPRVNCAAKSCTIAYEGPNETVLAQISEARLQYSVNKKYRTGIISMDSLGPDPISGIIKLNALGLM